MASRRGGSPDYLVTGAAGGEQIRRRGRRTRRREIRHDCGVLPADLRRGSGGDGGEALVGLRSDRGRAEERLRARRPAATSGVAGGEGGEGEALVFFVKKSLGFSFI